MRSQLTCLLTFILVCQAASACLGQAATPSAVSSQESTIRALVDRHGAAQAERIRTGVGQVASRWRAEDGDGKAFSEFCLGQFVSDSRVLEATFRRLEGMLEQIDGHLHVIYRDVNRPVQVDVGPMLPVDPLFAEFSPSAHLVDDLFKTRVAFVALLNFKIYTLEEKLRMGPAWSRDQWARARLAERFEVRVPASLLQAATQAGVRAEAYISSYNIFMHNLVQGPADLSPSASRLFPKGLRLITHWGLRDELKSWYGRPDALPRQRMIARVMERIVLQEIPSAVINHEGVAWDPERNVVYSGGQPVSAGREPDVRYQRLLDLFRAETAQDAFTPGHPTVMARRFERDRELPERRVEEILVSILSSSEVRDTARLVEKRLGRKLEPFDIWYAGFRPRSRHTEQDLDVITKRRYPTAQTFQRDIPRILRDLGFRPDVADFVASHVAVEPSRGAGHAMEAVMRGDRAHLRTRVGAEGMDYKGYNIATHELGHNVEQVFSLERVDHTLLRGVPNSAFTEALAFVFQNRNLALLGLSQPDAEAEALHALDSLWSTYEIAGVALLDMKVWHWMYEHPRATPAELRTAVTGLARAIWNQYYAPVLGTRDAVLLGIYSHPIEIPIYVPDYPIGHVIAFQVEQYVKKAGLGEQMERMCRQGRLTPDLWMQGAVGSPVTAQPMLRAARAALASFQRTAAFTFRQHF